MPDDRFNEYCEGLLASYKRRNTKAVAQRLESLSDTICKQRDHKESSGGLPLCPC